MAEINGTDAADRLIGTDADDVISGRGGDDVLNGGAGNDVLRPGEGRDLVMGGAGNDIVVVTEYDERFPDTFYGQGGQDTLDLSRTPPETDDGRDQYFAWEYFAGRDIFTIEDFFNDDRQTITFNGFEKMIGSSGTDYFRFYDSTTSLTIFAGSGDDFVAGGLGNDQIKGGTGDDSLYGEGGRDVLRGGRGDDLLDLEVSTGIMDGGAGTDTGVFYGSVNLSRGVARNASGDRQVVRSIENIEVSYYQDGYVASGNDNNNKIYAGFSFSGATLVGEDGNDFLIGSVSGTDILKGGDGNDVLKGNGGADVLTGGSGRDVFDLNSTGTLGGIDIIRDFNQTEHDRINMGNITSFNPVTIIHSRAFSGTALELRYDFSGGKTNLEIDKDGDGNADFELTLVGEIRFKASDFTYVPTETGGRMAADETLSYDQPAFAPHFPSQYIGMVAIV